MVSFSATRVLLSPLIESSAWTMSPRWESSVPDQGVHPSEDVPDLARAALHHRFSSWVMVWS